MTWNRQPLPSWRDITTRSAIVDVADDEIRVGAPGYVPVPERVAVFDNDEQADAGRDALPPVTDANPRDVANAFTGTITWLEMVGGKDSHDHPIPPEDFIQVAFARQ